jgi:hypothetical protein
MRDKERDCFTITLVRLKNTMEIRNCTCRLKAMYTETLPLNIVPTAANFPSSDTARADKVSPHGTDLFSEPSSGNHSCRNAFRLPILPTGFVSTKSRVLFMSPSTKPNLVTANEELSTVGYVGNHRITDTREFQTTKHAERAGLIH